MKRGYKQLLTHIGIPLSIGVVLTVLIVFFSRFKSPSLFNWHLFVFISVSALLIWLTFYWVAITAIKKEKNIESKVLLLRFGLALLLGIVLFDLLYVIIKWIDVFIYKSHDYLTIGHLVAASGVGLFSVFIIGGVETGYFFAIYWIEEKLLGEKREMELNRIQLHMLQQQLEPHFIFNSFSTLDGLINRDPEKASLFLHQLASFYHLVINTYEENLISLQDELLLVKTYVSILKLRFSNALEIRIEIADSLFDLKIPPLCLQLLIENAVKHNAVTQDDKLIVYLTSKNQTITVYNKKNPRNVSIHSPKIGLSNLKKRFCLHQKQFQIEETPEDFKVTFELIE